MNETTTDPGPRLPDAVAAALADPSPGLRRSGGDISYLMWGDEGGEPVLLLHGARASARTWWRVGPALAAAGARVYAPDLPGHGSTPSLYDRAAFEATAALVAVWARDLASRPFSVAGISWGSQVAAHLPGAGLPVRCLVVVEPPTITPEALAVVGSELGEAPGPTLEATRELVDSWHPGWPSGDRAVKAESLFALDPAMLGAVFAANPVWDGRLGVLEEVRRAGVDVWIVRGEPALGGLTPDSYIEEARRTWPPERIIEIAGAGHVIPRTHPEELVAVLLGAFGLETMNARRAGG